MVLIGFKLEKKVLIECKKMCVCITRLFIFQCYILLKTLWNSKDILKLKIDTTIKGLGMA